ncbi:MAG: hypothetical protein M3220_02120 [Chloroflexota bacterium]|nr:hypothetical protein [Chloroflexota bacterium]
MDDSNVPLLKKVRDAANCYHARFGEPATLCYANPVDVPEPTTIQGLRVEPRRNIRPHHFLVGRDPSDKVQEDKAA